MHYQLVVHEDVRALCQSHNLVEASLSSVVAVLFPFSTYVMNGVRKCLGL